MAAHALSFFGSIVDSPSEARDVDIACDGIPGWKLYEFAAKLEDELRIPFDVIPLSPANRLTHYIERKGKIIL